jgi:hypothetical protein
VDRVCVNTQDFSQYSHKMSHRYPLSPDGIPQKSVLTLVFLNRNLAEYVALYEKIEKLQTEVPEIQEIMREKVAQV